MSSTRRLRAPRLRALIAALGLTVVSTGCSVDVSFGGGSAADAVRHVDAGEVRPGDCFEDPFGGTEGWTVVDDVRVAACETPHDLEAYHSFELPEGGFPGQEAMEEAIKDGCLGAFDRFVGKPFADSDLNVTFFAPTAETWEEGDREVVCILYAMDGSPLVGSMAGSAR
jgi:hypothetical protein